MAKVYIYAMSLIALILALNLLGLNTATFLLFQNIGGTGDPMSSEMYTTIALIFSAGAVATIILGFFARVNTESSLVQTIAGFLMSWVSADLLSILVLPEITSAPAFVGNTLKLILIPLVVGFWVVIVQWWRGSDV